MEPGPEKITVKIERVRGPGKPPKYKNALELEDAIDAYFNEGVKLRTVIVGKGEKARILEVPIPTICGLCYYLGFASRQSFYDMEAKKDLSYTIKRARLFIEKEYEEQLQVGNTVGAIFALKNLGWTDKQDLNVTGEAIVIKLPEKFKDM